MKMGRKEARDITFKIIYQLEFQLADAETVIQNMIEEEEVTEKAVIQYINDVSKGIVDNKELVEEKIIKNLKENWDLSRISRINKAILKISVYELMFMKETVPAKVSINEALELVDTYGEPADKSFLNGILANVLKECEHD